MHRYSINKVIDSDVNISLPMSMFHTPVGTSESITRLVNDETNGRINPYQDDEQTGGRYPYINLSQSYVSKDLGFAIRLFASVQWPN